nr:immunoglobulin heavy chain junction region [Macaca mulatta]MOV57664.1 immunoglobulin heavy chain junction region [Macaca mulatta]MOV58597.1 immunoglobulin heavy chain junction region [Macaca mulatta]MOV58840.1 immunoglobulin heavy chain junction region [Macaca mulatta]MOV59004.1 immunoglobulin heavy chain junction region [Macaca mulatta]
CAAAYSGRWNAWYFDYW